MQSYWFSLQDKLYIFFFTIVFSITDLSAVRKATLFSRLDFHWSLVSVQFLFIAVDLFFFIFFVKKGNIHFRYLATTEVSVS